MGELLPFLENEYYCDFLIITLGLRGIVKL